MTHSSKLRAVPGPEIDARLYYPPMVIRLVAKIFAVNVRDLLRQDRRKHVSEARSAAYFLLRRHTRMSFPELARALGKKDHSSAMHGVQACVSRMETDDWFRHRLSNVELALEGTRIGETGSAA